MSYSRVWASIRKNENHTIFLTLKRRKSLKEYCIVPYLLMFLLCLFGCEYEACRLLAVVDRKVNSCLKII